MDMKKAATLLLSALLLVVSAGAFYFYKQAHILKVDPVARAERTDEIVVSMAGRHIVLPTGEVPKLVTIANLEETKGQPFFAKAKVGDKVLIYEQAKRVYLYDPVADILLEVSSLN